VAASFGLVHRPALREWLRSSVSWSLHFNDLRPPGADGFGGILNELKTLALFDDVTLIRDADIVNHIELLQIFRQNIDVFRSAILAGVFVFPIRQDVDSFTHLNDRAGLKRAHPERAEIASSYLAEFDQFLAINELVTPEMEVRTENSTFRVLLSRVMTHLKPKAVQYDLLQRTIAAAEKDSLGSQLRFGDIYKALMQPTNVDLVQINELVQWCRTAHVLTTPYELCLPPTSANSDIDPWNIAVVLGHSVTEENIRKNSWFERFPKLIPNIGWIEKLTFNEIVREFSATVRKSDAGVQRSRSSLVCSIRGP
jgi:hypothetical protein